MEKFSIDDAAAIGFINSINDNIDGVVSPACAPRAQDVPERAKRFSWGDGFGPIRGCPSGRHRWHPEAKRG